MAAVAVAGVASAQATITGAFNLDMGNTTTNAAKTIGMATQLLLSAPAKIWVAVCQLLCQQPSQTATGRNSDTRTTATRCLLVAASVPSHSQLPQRLCALERRCFSC